MPEDTHIFKTELARRVYENIMEDAKEKIKAIGDVKEAAAAGLQGIMQGRAETMQIAFEFGRLAMATAAGVEIEVERTEMMRQVGVSNLIATASNLKS